MHYYYWNVKDYLSHTSHLTDAEDLAYRRMLDLYYQTEKPFPDADYVARRVRASVETVEMVLREFFSREDDGWHNKRADEEIAKYQRLSEDGRRGAAKRWKTKESVGEKHGEAIAPLWPPHSPPNATPIATNNHKPLDKVKKEKHTPQVADLFPDVSPEVLDSFVKVRRSLRAPITELAATGIKREAAKAGISVESALTMCVERSWRGFKAEWVKTESKGFDWDTELRGAV